MSKVLPSGSCTDLGVRREEKGTWMESKKKPKAKRAFCAVLGSVHFPDTFSQCGAHEGLRAEGDIIKLNFKNIHSDSDMKT